MEIKELPIDQIRPNPNQPRKFLDESKLKELAESIKSRGLLEEILVRPKDEGFEIVHGERRWRACKLLGLKTIGAKVEDFSNEEAFELSLIENIQRENLTLLEEALAYNKLANRGLTHEEIAAKVNKSRIYITQKIRVLQLPFQVKVILKYIPKCLTEGHLKQLLRLKDIIGRHENLKRADKTFTHVLFIGKYPFKSWVGYYQDYFAWHETERDRLSVAELKERIDNFYFDIVSAIILSGLKLTPHLQEETDEAVKKNLRGESLSWWESELFCRWFEEGLREKMGLSKKTLEEKDWQFWLDYGRKHRFLPTEPIEMCLKTQSIEFKDGGSARIGLHGPFLPAVENNSPGDD